MFSTVFFAVALLSSVGASPAPAPIPNNPSPTLPSSCTDITSIVVASSATPYCSSYLKITDVTSYTTSTATSTVTVTTGEASTSIVFRPGNGPSMKRRDTELDAPDSRAQPPKVRLSERNTPSCNRDNCLRNLDDAQYSSSASAFCNVYTQTTTSIAVPTFIKNCGDPPSPSRLSSACSCIFPATTTTSKPPAYTSSACSCLGLTASTTTSTAIADVKTTVTVSPAVVTKTVYPCASPLPSPGPAYRLAGGNLPVTTNTLFSLDSPEGASAIACCNACFFELQNCVQANWFFYEGCVAHLGQSVVGNGKGVSATCPQGQIQGLAYGPDPSPPFRSTGDIAGPCGQRYSGY